MFALRADGLSRAFGALMAVNKVDLRVPKGEIRALIGPNGAGKSTLLNLLSGSLLPTAGRIYLQDADITRLPVHERVRRGLSRSYQVVHLFPELSCREVVRLAMQRDLPLRDWMVRQGMQAIERRADEVLAAAGLQEVADLESVGISHGLRKRLEIALALANDARLLLLDEPMAGMSALERESLCAHMRSLAGARTIVFVEHDMDMVMSLADTVTVLHNGIVIAEGTPAEVRSSAAAQEAYLGSQP